MTDKIEHSALFKLLDLKVFDLDTLSNVTLGDEDSMRKVCVSFNQNVVDEVRPVKALNLATSSLTDCIKKKFKASSKCSISQ